MHLQAATESREQLMHSACVNSSFSPASLQRIRRVRHDALMSVCLMQLLLPLLQQEQAARREAEMEISRLQVPVVLLALGPHRRLHSSTQASAFIHTGVCISKF